MDSSLEQIRLFIHESIMSALLEVHTSRWDDEKPIFPKEKVIAAYEKIVKCKAESK